MTETDKTPKTEEVKDKVQVPAQAPKTESKVQDPTTSSAPASAKPKTKVPASTLSTPSSKSDTSSTDKPKDSPTPPTKNTDSPSKDKPKDSPSPSKEKPTEKPKEPEKPKKDEAVARGQAVPISKKQAMYICSFIKHKPIDKAIKELHEVILMKRAIPFKGEIPHRKGKMQSGRYPVKAAGFFINILKALKGNVAVNGLEIDNARISIATASWARRPMRSGGKAAKRTNVTLTVKRYKGKKK